MNYEPIKEISRFEAESEFASGRSDAIVHALIGLALYHSDWPWVQEKCVQFSQNPDIWVRRACATALLHIARVHGMLNTDQADIVFERLLGDPELAGETRDTLDEIRAFLQPRDNPDVLPGIED